MGVSPPDSCYAVAHIAVCELSLAPDEIESSFYFIHRRIVFYCASCLCSLSKLPQMDIFFKGFCGIIKIMKWLFGLLAIPLLTSGVLSPELAAAQNDFVPCSGTNCTACHLLDMIQTIVFWLATVFTIIAIGIVMYAGFKLATSGGNMTAKDAAKALMINGLIGLVIVLAGWFIVDTIMKILLNDGSGINYGMWHEVSCGGQPPVEDPDLVLIGEPSFGEEGRTVNQLSDIDISRQPQLFW